MTDNYIIKAAECCLRTRTKDDCAKIGCPSCYENGGCHLYDTVDDDYYALFYWFTEKLLEITNRQKAEIEKLRKDYGNMGQHALILIGNARNEAVEEFAAKLKAKVNRPESPWEDSPVCVSDIDEVLEEMAGEN